MNKWNEWIPVDCLLGEHSGLEIDNSLSSKSTLTAFFIWLLNCWPPTNLWSRESQDRSWLAGSNWWTGLLTRQHHRISKRWKKGCGIHSILLGGGKQKGAVISDSQVQWLPSGKKEPRYCLLCLSPKDQDVVGLFYKYGNLQSLVKSILHPPPPYLVVIRNQWCSRYQLQRKHSLSQQGAYVTNTWAVKKLSSKNLARQQVNNV